MLNNVADRLRAEGTEQINGAESNLNNFWNILIDEYTIPLLEHCLCALHDLYTCLTFVNTIIFVIKYGPTGFYIYKFMKDVYITSRKRIKQKQIEMEDIQLQIQIINTKLCVKDAEFSERTEQLRREAERLRIMRTRVRDVIVTDEFLRSDLESIVQWDADDIDIYEVPKNDERECLLELFKVLKHEQLAKTEKASVNLDYDERAQMELRTPEDSVYSSITDADMRQDCRVKIVKVTNVYKIAYLKNYIKQKRLRKATKQALLKKKMETIKKLLEDWQKALNRVINSKLTILNIDRYPINVPSQEAMGDYSKPHGSSDSDSDIRNSWSDVCYDEYSLNWTQNPYKPYAYNYEDIPDTNVSKELYDTQDYGDGQYSTPPVFSDLGKAPNPNMVAIIEETNSQIAIEDIKNESDDDYECHDLVVF